MENTLTQLKEIGLTDGEVKVYLALLKLGQSKTGPIATKASVSSSKVYKILARLETKGLVSRTIKQKVAFFRALEPKRLLDYINEEKNKLDEKKNIIEKMLPSLEKQMKSNQESQTTMYTGMKAVTNFFRNILDELKKGDVYYVIGARYIEDKPEHQRFFLKYHQLRALKGIKVMMLANNEIKNTIVPTTKNVAEIRFLPDYLMSNMQTLFYKNKTMIIIWTTEPVGFLIESEEVRKSFQKYFETFWKIAQP